MTTNLADQNSRNILSHSSVGEKSQVVSTSFFAQGLKRLKKKMSAGWALVRRPWKESTAHPS